MSLLYVLAMFLLFSLSIFVHELGHFLAARAFGMVADVFSIGLGPALWKRKVGATTYKLGWIPFGGYVALADWLSERGYSIGKSAEVPAACAAVSGATTPSISPLPKFLPRGDMRLAMP